MIQVFGPGSACWHHSLCSNRRLRCNCSLKHRTNAAAGSVCREQPVSACWNVDTTVLISCCYYCKKQPKNKWIYDRSSGAVLHSNKSDHSCKNSLISSGFFFCLSKLILSQVIKITANRLEATPSPWPNSQDGCVCLMWSMVIKIKTEMIY